MWVHAVPVDRLSACVTMWFCRHCLSPETIIYQISSTNLPPNRKWRKQTRKGIISIDSITNSKFNSNINIDTRASHIHNVSTSQSQCPTHTETNCELSALARSETIYTDTHIFVCHSLNVKSANGCSRDTFTDCVCMCVQSTCKQTRVTESKTLDQLEQLNDRCFVWARLFRYNKLFFSLFLSYLLSSLFFFALFP